MTGKRNINWKRLLRHLFAGQGVVTSVFTPDLMRQIEERIVEAERHTLGELRFVVEGGLPPLQVMRGYNSRDRALDLFSQLHVWDTEHNSGILIYVQMLDRKVEILADRGIHARVGNEVWRNICHDMEVAFRHRQFAEGCFQALDAAHALLKEHFPAAGNNPDELPNSPVIL